MSLLDDIGFGSAPRKESANPTPSSALAVDEIEACIANTILPECADEARAQLTALQQAVADAQNGKTDAERWRAFRKMAFFGTDEDGGMGVYVRLTHDDEMDDDGVITAEAAPYLTEVERKQISGQAPGQPDHASCADRAVDAVMAARTPDPAREEQSDG